MGRVGSRRSDRRWKADDGQVWASKFEWEVFDALQRAGVSVRKCDSGDTITYHQARPNVRCMDCRSSNCSQERTYTPDLFVLPKSGKDNRGGYFIEVKGYFRDEKRALFRCLRTSRSDIDIRCVFAANHWVTKGKTRLDMYFDRYVKNTPYHFWDGGIPGDWQ